MIAGVVHLIMSFERAMRREEATKKGQVQEFFYKNSKEVRDNPRPNGSTSLRKWC